MVLPKQVLNSSATFLRVFPRLVTSLFAWVTAKALELVACFYFSTILLTMLEPGDL